jgi:hypothetical protein
MSAGRRRAPSLEVFGRNALRLFHEDHNGPDFLSVDPFAPIDLRTGIVMLLADVTRTGGWSASRDGGIGSGTRIARLRLAASWVV